MTTATPTTAAPTTAWLLTQYAAGTLPPAAHVLAASYLDLNPAGREGVAQLEAVGGWSIETTEPAPLGAGRSAARLLDSIGAGSGTGRADTAAGSLANDNGAAIPAPLAAALDAPLHTLSWKWRAPGAYEHRIASLETGGLMARLLRIEPGRAIPQHTHDGIEATLVLDGAYSDASGRFGRGDLELAGEETDHRPIAEAGGPCLCFAVSEANLRLTGPLGRVLRAVTGHR